MLDESAATCAWTSTDTNVPGIHAVGDVTGQVELTPVKRGRGRQFGGALVNDSLTRTWTTVTSSVVFSHPPIVMVGSPSPLRLGSSTATTPCGVPVRLHRYVLAVTRHRQSARMKLVCGVDERIVGTTA